MPVISWAVRHAAGILKSGVIIFTCAFSSRETRVSTETILTSVSLISRHYRLIIGEGAEFGHYRTWFLRRILFKFITLCTCRFRLAAFTGHLQFRIYDRPYENTGVMSSEMSGAFRYEIACARTPSVGRPRYPCWDHFEDGGSNLWGARQPVCPHIKASLPTRTNGCERTGGVFCRSEHQHGPSGLYLVI